MLKNIYAPASAAILQEQTLDIISNNLSNTATTSFKEDLMASTATLPNPWPNYKDPNPPAPFKTDMSSLVPLHGNEIMYVALAEVKTDHSQGPIIETNKECDVAFEDENSFFEISSPFGSRYTRDGSFTVTPEGVLATSLGHPVQGENGILAGFNGSPVRINPSREVFCGEKFIGKIKAVNFEDKKNLERLGSNMWVYNGNPDGITNALASVRQGCLEGSNVNPVKNLVNMITAYRNYEASQKTIRSLEETMKMANKLPEVQG
jgi:flagellar basal-body rod protein FlgF